MNKIQYIKLLNLRGIFELKGQSIAQAIKNSGGEPTLEEMVRVNEEAIKYYIEQFNSQVVISKTFEEEVKRLNGIIEELEEDSLFLSCLEGAGVDNWDGYSYALEMLEEIKNKK